MSNTTQLTEGEIATILRALHGAESEHRTMAAAYRSMGTGRLDEADRRRRRIEACEADAALEQQLTNRIVACRSLSIEDPGGAVLTAGDLESRLTEIIATVTDVWDEPLDDVHDIPPIVTALIASGVTIGHPEEADHAE